jgi:hypothetical protein
MDTLTLQGTDDTPEILLDKKNGIFEISGRSLPEDAIEFYRPVLEWIAQYKKEPNPKTEFVFKLEYTNTASSKLIQDVLFSLENLEGVNIVWCHQEDDDDMDEMGHEYSEIVDLPFEFKTY